jgi:glucose/arabinose dehydrogenase
MLRLRITAMAAAIGGAAVGQPPGAVELPKPFHSKSAQKFSRTVAWPEGKTPTAPEGFEVTRFTDNVESPRWIYVLPNGDVLVSQANGNPPQHEAAEKKKKKTPPDPVQGKKGAKPDGSTPNIVRLYRDTNGDGKPDEDHILVEGIRQPLGMAVHNDTLYVAASDAVYSYPFKVGGTKVGGEGKRIVELPGGGYNQHWTRNVVVSPDGTKLFISVGSATNVDEENKDRKDPRRAAIMVANLDGSEARTFASGLRNPVGLAFEPVTKKLWTAVNEREHLGDELVPDYITSVQDGGFYGWPYAYFGKNLDPRHKNPPQELIDRVITPDFAVGSHTASLGLCFYDGKTFPEKYYGGAFIGQHGSWNRSTFSGYAVTFVPFREGKPSGPMENFLAGFIADEAKGTVYGRPAGFAVAKDGALLVADDSGGVIWRVQAKATP